MIIAPSVLSLDYSNMENQVQELNESNAKWIHFDVMDGHFVPNLTFGPDILKGFKKMSPLFMDVHLMVENPKMFVKPFSDAGADLITFHYEACANEKEILEVIDEIKAHDKKVGISIKPNTSVEVLKPFLDVVDLFLIMSVEPGFGGQAFMENSLDKISTLATWLKEKDLDKYIEVDGGINAETGLLAKQAGANVLVAGSYIFKNEIKKAVDSLV